MSAAHNRLWATLLVEELRRQGVGFVAVSPGSRSAPLALAVAESGLDHAVHFDERGAAFMALGHARATGRPAAVVTTSGTAVANLYPAVVEADLDGVPLLLLTADRPPELRATGANQTMDQVKVFGDRVRWYYELPVPSADVDPALVLTTAGAAVRHALHLPRGPVHLNVPFREPLVPGPDDAEAEIPAHIAAWRASDRPYTESSLREPASAFKPYWHAPRFDEVGGPESFFEDQLQEVERGVVVVGRLSHVGSGMYEARALAHHLGWPLFPDVLSGARVGDAGATGVPFYDLALLSERFAAAHQPDAVLMVGDAPLSKRLWTWLGRARPRIFAVVRPGIARLDPAHLVTHHFAGSVAETLQSLRLSLEGRPAGPWATAWQHASAAAGQVVSASIDGSAGLTEMFVARTTARSAPQQEPFIVAASMPIRDLDQFADPSGPAVPIFANRGASGIDGTIATAVGVARGHGCGATVLIGDLALLHDLNSLALLRDGPRVVVVVLNNDGGGIFSFLPVAKHAEAPAFERMFGTPHGLGFRYAAEMFGLAYAAPETPEAFREAYRAALARETSSVIEVRTDRAANHALHLDVQAQVRAAVDALVP